jgi:hypothetical protein
VPLPETIPVRYTEEEADNFSIRPVKRQTFRLRELVDMVLRVTGKDLPRVQQILRSGTLVYHFYRYWWQGFEADAAELSALLAEFPGDDPGRAFRQEDCAIVLIEGGTSGRKPVEIERQAAERKPLFAARSFWGCLVSLAQKSQPVYAGYSFDRRADLYQVELSAEQASSLQRDAARLAPRPVRASLDLLEPIARLTFVVPRNT